jgi:hypothetical protein
MKARSLTFLAGFVATGALVAALAGGYLTSSAGALTAIATVENVSTAQVPIKYSASTSPDSTFTTVDSVSLASGVSYVIFAKVGLRNASGGSPLSLECYLQAPNEPADIDTAAFPGTKGSTLDTLSFMAVSQGTSAGTASLSCRVTNSAFDGAVIAHHARIIAIPVDAVSNNLHTLPSA